MRNRSARGADGLRAPARPGRNADGGQWGADRGEQVDFPPLTSAARQPGRGRGPLHRQLKDDTRPLKGLLADSPPHSHAEGGAQRTRLIPPRRRDLAGWFVTTCGVPGIRACVLSRFCRVATLP
jgi:hypothetical protein